jgi:hypothetical protein
LKNRLAVGLLLLSPLEWPAGYYLVLRVVVTTASLQEAARTAGQPNAGWPQGFLAMAVLLNPIAPVQMQSKAAWLPLDLIAVAILLAAHRLVRAERGARNV